MSARVLHKDASRWRIAPNLKDYAEVRRDFSWQQARAELDGLPDGGLNIGYEAVDRHALGANANKRAIRFLRKDGRREDYTYAQLKTATDRFMAALRAAGIGKGDRVFALAGRVPEFYVAALGTLKNGSVFCPLFSAFGPEPIRTRMARGNAKLLVTTGNLYRRKVRDIRDALPELQQVVIVEPQANGETRPGTQTWNAFMESGHEAVEIAATRGEDMALLHFTSGTTGRPKGAIHVHEAVVQHYVTGKYVLDLHPEDIFWCTADPGWVTGMSYGVIAPLVHGVSMIVDEEEFDAEHWYRVLQDEQISVWYTAPTAIRMLMKTGVELTHQYHFEKLRFMASVGEPLNPEAVLWGVDTFGIPFHDNWWQTETGGIMIANFPAVDIKPGSMGMPVPGVLATIVSREADGHVVPIGDAKVEGELALRPGWPAMFRGYLGEEERYNKCFVDGWYLTGDLAMRDSEGYFWFVGRADDVIKSAGHLIGPFEVESALMEHPAVAEAAVIGKPDPVIHEMVKAFVALRPGYAVDEALRLEILGFARKRLGAAVAPKEIAFLETLPHTRSGKIMRRLLKARELGLPEGDTSTLESPA
ncbi:MAG TPA: acetate--CoA ligase [Gammaproteobacteria bacterium]